MRPRNTCGVQLFQKFNKEDMEKASSLSLGVLNLTLILQMLRAQIHTHWELFVQSTLCIREQIKDFDPDALLVCVCVCACVCVSVCARVVLRTFDCRR